MFTNYNVLIFTYLAYSVCVVYIAFVYHRESRKVKTKEKYLALALLDQCQQPHTIQPSSESDQKLLEYVTITVKNAYALIQNLYGLPPSLIPVFKIKEIETQLLQLKVELVEKNHFLLNTVQQALCEMVLFENTYAKDSYIITTSNPVRDSSF